MWFANRLRVASTLWSAHKAGIRDGNIGLPRSDQHDNRGTYAFVLETQARELGERVRRRWTREEDAFSARLRQREEAYRRAKEDFEGQLETYQKERAFEGWPYVNSTAYTVLMLVLAIGEIPMNMVVFRLFGEMELYNLMVALVLAVVLPLAAHLMGVKLKLLRRELRDVFVICFWLAIVLPALPLIGVLREHYLAQNGMPMDRFLTLSFIVIQLLVFWGAVVLSYAHSSPWLKTRMQSARDRWMSSAIRLEKMKAYREWEVNYWRNGMDRVKDVYVAANLRARQTKTPVPLVFYLEDYDESIRNPMGS